MHEPLLSIFNQFMPSKVMLIGDFMLDVYTLGKVRRISPEAPVSILNVEKETRLPGGAGNVILNAVSLDLDVVAFGRVGDDASGQFILKTLAEENVDIRGIFIDPRFQTPLKNRFIADNQQIVRIDYENPTQLDSELEAKMIAFLPHLLEGVQLIAVSDYAKGLITPSLFSGIMRLANERSIRVIVDPKGKDFKKYKGAYLVKPNLNEAIQAANLDPEASLDKVAAKIIKEADIEALLITKSKDGMSLFLSNGSDRSFPVAIREVKDVTGAGDTVLAMIMAALANGWDLEVGIQLANTAAGIAVEKLGCARVGWGDLLERLLEVDVKNKVFGEDHLFILQEVIKDKEFVILALSGSDGLTTSIFKAILSLFQKKQLIVLYMLDQVEEEFLYLLASLKEVSFIILKTQSLHHLCEQIHPKKLYLINDKELHSFKDPLQFLEFLPHV